MGFIDYGTSKKIQGNFWVALGSFGSEKFCKKVWFSRIDVASYDSEQMDERTQVNFSEHSKTEIK